VAGGVEVKAGGSITPAVLVTFKSSMHHPNELL
jgi:hypothetical protein